MAGLKKETQMFQQINVTGGAVSPVTFNNYHPSVFQIRNFGNDVLYVATSSNVNANKFEMSIVSGGTRVFTFPQGTQFLYFFSPSSLTVTVMSWESNEVYPNDLDSTQISAVVQNVVTPNVAITSALPVGNNHIGIVTLDNANIAVTTQSEVEVKNDSGNPIPMTSVDVGLKADTKATDSTSSWSMIALLKGIFDKIINNGVTLSTSEIRPSSTPTIINVSCVTANTEYSAVLPYATRRFSVTNAEYDSTNFTSIYYSSGASTVIKVRGDSSYNEADLKLLSATNIYFKCSVANRTIQIVCWA